MGQLSRARRWDLTASNPDERSSNGTLGSSLPARAPDVELGYSYDGAGRRVLKTAVDPSAIEQHTVYIFGGLELRGTSFTGSGASADYTLNAQTETVYLPAGGARARVLYAEEDLPTLTSGNQHVFLIFADHLGSGSFIIDHETGELVEYSTYQAYGQTDSDYRPGRWGEFREPYKFSGKEEDVEVGLAYFGARYLSLGLGRWMSADPATIHELRSDANPYSYVKGRPLVAVDPNGRVALLTIGIGVAIGAAIGGGSYIAANGADFTSADWWGGFGVSVLMGAGAGGLMTTGVGWGLAGAYGATTLAGFAAVGLTGAGAGMLIGTEAAILRGEGAGGIALGGLETGLTTGGGAMLGYGTGFVAGSALASTMGTGYGVAGFLAGAGAVSAGTNGAFTGARQVYNWRGGTGFLAFGLDSTWGIVGTTLGNVLNIGNTVSGAEYNDDLSRRQDRQVFNNGFPGGSRFAHTQGNVISNLESAGGSDALLEHETIHVWQSRLLGPLMQGSYVAHGAHGLAEGLGFWALHSIVYDDDPNLGEVLETTMYRNQPMEQMAYRWANPDSLGGVEQGGYPRAFLPWWINGWIP